MYLALIFIPIVNPSITSSKDGSSSEPIGEAPENLADDNEEIWSVPTDPSTTFSPQFSLIWALMSISDGFE